MLNTLKRWFIFESRFLSEDERYDKYLWLLKLSLLSTVFYVLAYVVNASAALFIMGAINTFLYLWLTVIIWQEAWKSRAVHFIFRLMLCAASSIFLTMMLFAFLGPLAFVLMAMVTVFANRKQLRKFLPYKKFLQYVGLWMVLTLLIFVLDTIWSLETAAEVFNLPIFLNLIKRLILFYFLYRLLRHEYLQGRPLKESIRILLLIPLTGLFLLLGWLTILPFGNVSSKSLFGDKDHDFLAMPGHG
ncbi:hypothetical protein SELR_pSRC102520 (plasmid) [Selenomonas ruminantium subsp. lactilytica TAM6421]|uniref:Uncharacterized protein n=1 Tax=Selenomonas ruminantium subsp. lactilytica (strain NBRC 103574 / TAM6421) TaxID=927704 RepID=I0GWC2_SELRL|nr:hypothetical protein [Selenomonas ruminantium]BAL85059.1 hypothetical protein SELR_pSRC102520 [Selenomonas ruminantium subsp. lactilytica TAM6421]